MIVRVSETYDLSTKPDKMGLLGIHTPDGKLVYSMWKGLFQNFRKMRYVSCDIAMACASMLPADPLQIGVEAGDIAPQDMFNPILYKAVSNDSMSNLLNKIYAGGGYLDATWLNKNSVSSENTPGFVYNDTQDIDQFAMYYGLLSDTSGWKKAMPQAGLGMKGLVPLTFSLLATQGQPSISGSLSNSTLYYPRDGDNTNSTKIVTGSTMIGRFMRGNTQRMPAFDTMVMTSDGSSANVASLSTFSANNVGAFPKVGDNVSPLPVDPGDFNHKIIVPNLDAPNCFVAAIVLPPAKLNRLYYRLKVTWTIEFSGPRPLTDITNWYGLALAGNMSYGSDYEEQSTLITKSAGKQEGMVDVGDVDITKVMEGSK